MNENLEKLKNQLTDCSNLFYKKNEHDTQKEIKDLGTLFFEKFKKHSIRNK